MTQHKALEDQKPPQTAAASAQNAEPSDERDYAEVIGVFKDDPMLDAMMENIRQRRREMDADDKIESGGASSASREQPRG